MYGNVFFNFGVVPGYFTFSEEFGQELDKHSENL
jgi:hypothetical protein